MKIRPNGFLAEDKISHDSEIFDYISELHGYIWLYIDKIMPGASGNIRDYIDKGLEVLDNYNRILDEHEKEIDLIQRLHSGL